VAVSTSADLDGRAKGRPCGLGDALRDAVARVVDEVVASLRAEKGGGT
jgi:hypothetical protein